MFNAVPAGSESSFRLGLVLEEGVDRSALGKFSARFQPAGKNQLQRTCAGPIAQTGNGMALTLEGVLCGGKFMP